MNLEWKQHSWNLLRQDYALWSLFTFMSSQKYTQAWLLLTAPWGNGLLHLNFTIYEPIQGKLFSWLTVIYISDSTSTKAMLISGAKRTVSSLTYCALMVRRLNCSAFLYVPFKQLLINRIPKVKRCILYHWKLWRKWCLMTTSLKMFR